MSIIIKKSGYGQVEPNHLSGMITGQIYAQLPADENIVQLEQGQFAKYDYAQNKVNFTGQGQFLLVYNEEKLYDSRKQNHKNFVYITKDFTDNKLYPRLIKTNIGDILTTNTIAADGGSTSAVVGTAIVGSAEVGSSGGGGGSSVSGQVTLAINDYLTINENGFLTLANNPDLSTLDMVWKVIKETSMPDGQSAVKIQRIQ